MKIGIIGGNGNISRYISDRLVAAGHEVVAFNRSGVAPDGAQVVQVDRTDTEVFVEAVQSQKLDVGIDMIVFTAADAKITVRAFDGVKQLIHCSTGATYGFPLPMPVTEELPCIATQTYGKNKNEADSYFLRSWWNDRFPVTILKPNITYGFKWANVLPGQMPGSWLRRLVDGKPIVTVGDGDQIHHFLYADDSARGFVGCIGNKKTIGQVFNICANRTYTWRMFYDTVMDILGLRVPIVGIPRGVLLALADRYPELEDRNFWHHMDHSNEKLRRIVPDFHELHSLAEGLNKILRNFDPKAVAPNKPGIDEMLDDLVDRQQRAIG